MPSFEKSPQELVSLYRDIMTNFPETSQRLTFGYPCAYINGHMVTGLFADKMFVRLSPDDESELLAIAGATSFSPMQNRPMKNYVVLPESVLGSKKQLSMWISRSIDHVSSLPAKEKKPTKKKPLHP